MGDNEKILLQKAKTGDIDAFEQLIETYQKKIFNLSLRMIGNYDDANDLAQEVLIRIFKSISTFKEQSTFSTWIYRITTNVCLDAIRKQKNKNVVSLDVDITGDDGDMKRQVESDEPLPDVVAENNELRKDIQAAIKGLPEEHRIVVILRDIQGLSYEEIACILKCPEGTVKSRINRARQTLRIILQPKRELLDE